MDRRNFLKWGSGLVMGEIANISNADVEALKYENIKMLLPGEERKFDLKLLKYNNIIIHVDTIPENINPIKYGKIEAFEAYVHGCINEPLLESCEWVNNAKQNTKIILATKERFMRDFKELKKIDEDFLESIVGKTIEEYGAREKEINQMMLAVQNNYEIFLKDPLNNLDFDETQILRNTEK